MATDECVERAARSLHAAWRDHARIAHLPPDARPATRADGYRVQSRLVTLSGDRPVGWKIAATSVAGQRHIGVPGPLAGRILATTTYADAATVALGANALRVAEAEFGFLIGRPVDGDPEDPPGVAAVIDAVQAFFPAIELPDSRFLDVAGAGEAHLVADLACAGPIVTGPPVADGWRDRDLAAHEVRMSRDGEVVATGRGANALGDPRIALAWLAAELLRHGHRLEAGDLVITGTCITPVPVGEGQRLVADFGPLGAVAVTLA